MADGPLDMSRRGPLDIMFPPDGIIGGSGEAVNIKEKYNVYGDGIHDDTEAIQEALAEELHLFFPAGTYIIDPTEGLSVRPGATLRGQGMYSTLFQLKSGVNVLNNLIKVEDAGGVLLEDFAVDGNKSSLSTDREVSTNYGVYLANSPESRVNRVRVYNMTGVGIHLYNSNATTITGCITSDNEYHGYELEQTLNCVLENNDAHGNIRHGVFVSPGEVGGTGSIGNLITDNVFYNNLQYGVAFGIDAAGGSIGLTRDNIVSDNIIRNNLHYGVSLYWVDSTTLTDNLIELNGKIGVHVYKSQNNIITNNRIRHNSQEGSGLYDEILLEGAGAAEDPRGSYQNLIANNFIETGASTGDTNANWAIREENIGDGNNVIKNNYVPWAGVSGKVEVLNPETSWEFLGDGIEDEVSFRYFAEGLAIAPNATLSGGLMGFDAPFGTAVLRMFSDIGSLQFVAPNGGLDMYLGGVNAFSLSATQATFVDGLAIVAGSTNGLKIGTATSQKLGFFNAAPIIQPTATADLGVALSNLGLRAAGTAYPITTSGNINATGTSIFGGIFRTTGGFQSTPITRTGAVTLATSSPLINFANATTAPFTITLPSAAATAGQSYYIKKIDASANAVTIGTTSSQTIDGSTTYVLSTQYKYVFVVSDGSNWFIMGSN